MKCLGVFLCFLAVAAASLHEALDVANAETLKDFYSAPDRARPLRDVAGVDKEVLELTEQEIRTELGRLLKESLDQITEGLKDALERGKNISSKWIEKFQDLKRKFKEFREHLRDKARELLDELRRMRAEQALEEALLRQDEAMRSASLQSIFENIKKKIMEKWTSKELQEYIENAKGILGDMARVLLETLRKGGKEALDHVIDTLLDKLPPPRQEAEEAMLLRASSIMDIFNDLKEKIEEQFPKEILQKHIEKAKGVLGDVARVLLEALREGGKQALDKMIDHLLDKLPPPRDRSRRHSTIAVYRSDKIKGIFKNLKDKIKKKLSSKEIQEYIEKMKGTLGDLARNLLETIREGGKEALDKLIDSFLDKLPPPRDAKAEGRILDWISEWTKETWEEALERIKDKVEFIRVAAKHVIDNVRDEKLLQKALDIFRPYREHLGDLWEKLVELYYKTLDEVIPHDSIASQ